jgi:transketolase N-terminal domain/subunit
LKMITRAQGGHIGASLSETGILTAFFSVHCVSPRKTGPTRTGTVLY